MSEDEKNKGSQLGKKDRVEILMEDMIHDFKAVREGHGILLSNLKEVERKVDTTKKDLEDIIMSNSKALHGRIDKVEQKVDVLNDQHQKTDEKIEVMDKKIDKLDEKMTERQDKIEEKVDLVHQKVFLDH